MPGSWVKEINQNPKAVISLRRSYKLTTSHVILCLPVPPVSSAPVIGHTWEIPSVQQEQIEQQVNRQRSCSISAYMAVAYTWYKVHVGEMEV
jgi:hypothetical protein